MSRTLSRQEVEQAVDKGQIDKHCRRKSRQEDLGGQAGKEKSRQRCEKGKMMSDRKLQASRCAGRGMSRQKKSRQEDEQ
jgi:hypothetical protein